MNVKVEPSKTSTLHYIVNSLQIYWQYYSGILHDIMEDSNSRAEWGCDVERTEIQTGTINCINIAESPTTGF